MVIDYGRIVLDSPNGTYITGQTIRGNLIFQQDTVKTYRAIWVRLRGCCRVHWKVTESIRDEIETKNYDSYDEYINMKVYLDLNDDGGESGKKHIQSGKLDYPFTFQLPANSPSSFEGKYGHVRYEIKAIIDRVFKFDQERVAIRVIAPLDLNLDPFCKQPLEMELNESYCCWCFSAGSVEAVIKAPVSGYCPGQKIPIEMKCISKGNLDVRNIKLRIVKKIEYIATRHPGRRKDKDLVMEITKGAVFGNSSRSMTISMDVPTLDVYNLSGCSYINLEYKLQVVVCLNECHNDAETSCKIVIGTIPLVGYQDNAVIPLQNQIPPSVPAIAHQPMSSFAPSPVSYPGDIAPYSTSTFYPNSPNHNHHYPPTYAPPSNPNIPPSNPNVPFLTNNPFNSLSPYPPNNPPLSSSNPPYPSNNSSITPYRNQNPPYPDDPPPYPCNPHYPAGQQNPPDIGFIVPSSENWAVISTSSVPEETVQSVSPSAPALE